MNPTHSEKIASKNEVTIKQVIKNAESEGVDFREMTYSLLKENVRLHLLVELKEKELQNMLNQNYELTIKLQDRNRISLGINF